MNELENVGSLGTEQVFPCLGTVVRSTQNGGKSKQEHGDGNEAAAQIALGEYRIKCAAHQGSVCVARQNLAGFQIVSTTSQYLATTVGAPQVHQGRDRGLDQQVQVWQYQ